MRYGSKLVAAFLATALSATPALAQMATAKGGVSVGVAVGMSSLSGDDYTDVNSGIGFEGSVRYTLTPQISLTGGVSVASHGLEGIDENLSDLRIFVEPQYAFKMSSPTLVPFVGARIAYASQSATVGDEIKWTGFAFGASGGARYSFSPQVALEGAVSFMSIKMGDAKVAGETQAGTDLSGTNLGVRVGVVFSFSSR